MGSSLWFVLSTFVLCLYYLLGGFKIFKSEGNSSLIIPILAGLSLATSIITIPYNIFLRNWEWLQALPVINIIFTTYLAGLAGFKWIKKTTVQRNYRLILCRTSIVLMVTCFFAFSSTGNSLYRKAIIFLNAGNGDISSNMRMFDLVERTDEQLEAGNCDKAVKLSLQAFEAGLNWLRIDADSLTDKDRKQLWKIQGVYTKVYEAYDCKARKLFDSGNYSYALYYQIRADSFLTLNPTARNAWWRNERAVSKHKIGLCYDRLHQYDSSVAYFNRAIQYHVDSIGEFNTNLSTYLNSLASSLAAGGYWDESNQFAKQSIFVLDRDSVSNDKGEKYAQPYFQLVYNSIAENKVSRAKEYLTLVKEYLNPEKTCEYFLYNSILAARNHKTRKSVHAAKKARGCFIEHFGDKYQNVAECYLLLFHAWVNIPNYDSALVSIQKAMEITEANYGSSSIRFHDFLKSEGYYHYYTGNYDESLTKLLTVKGVYESEFGNDSNKLPEVLAKIGKVKVEQGYFDEAKTYARESLRIANLYDSFVDDRTSGLLNNIADVYYATDQDFIAETLYQKSIHLNIAGENKYNPAVAGALNGLGLLAMKNSDLTMADSLFNRSLQVYRSRFSDLHPDIGIVLMNKSTLLFKRKDLPGALSAINEALANFTPFHRSNHPIIGDMLSLKASFLVVNGERTKAQTLLRKVLEIYESNFQPDHDKITEARRRVDN